MTETATPVTPELTLEVLAVQHEHALDNLLVGVDRLGEALSVSDRVVPVSEELRASLVGDQQALPEMATPDARRAAEPYRRKCSFIRQRLLNTRRRLREGVPSHPGRDYRNAGGLVADLLVMDRSLRAHQAESMADGCLAEVVHTALTFGLQLATMDLREHAEHHHAALAELLASRRGDLPRNAHNHWVDEYSKPLCVKGLFLGVRGRVC